MKNGLKILALEYELIWSDHEVMDGAGAYGICNTEFLTIRLDKTQPECRKKVTLLHEILHAINDQLQLQEAGADEDIATRISVGLMTVARENPDWWKWIFS